MPKKIRMMKVGRRRWVVGRWDGWRGEALTGCIARRWGQVLDALWDLCVEVMCRSYV